MIPCGVQIDSLYFEGFEGNFILRFYHKIYVIGEKREQSFDALWRPAELFVPLIKQCEVPLVIKVKTEHETAGAGEGLLVGAPVTQVQIVQVSLGLGNTPELVPWLLNQTLKLVYQLAGGVCQDSSKDLGMHDLAVLGLGLREHLGLALV